MKNRITTFIKRFINKEGVKTFSVTAEVEMPIFKIAFDDYFFRDLSENMSEKCVNEMWKKYGTDIMRKVDKKTIGNLTVKKLSTLIAKEITGTNKSE